MDFYFDGNTEQVKLSFEETQKDGITYVKICADFAELTSPEEFAVCFDLENRGAYSTWSPTLGGSRDLTYSGCARRTDSRFSCGTPVTALIDKWGDNCACLSLADCVTPTALCTSIIEQNCHIKCQIRFFTRRVSPLTHYETVLRIDRRKENFCNVIRDVASWWENECNYTPASVPDCAFDVVDSTWYSFHQKVYTHDLLKEFELSSKLGMKTVIIDDGWQTSDNGGNYTCCGDWELAEDKIPDMRTLSDEIHKLGMKVMIWYTVPFLGKYSKCCEDWVEYCLDANKRYHDTFTFDPRYPEVRDYLVNIYAKAVKEWDLDGVKLDFIDYFEITDHACEPDPRRDIDELEDGIEALLRRVHEELTAIKPDILIEYRQYYVGPAVRQYGNMMRVRDCAGDALVNRRSSIDLRLTNGGTAVHSDMIMWDYADIVENAALQVYATFYSVPQISVRIYDLPGDHKKMLEYLLKVQNEYADVLLHGDISAYDPAEGYSYIAASKGEREFITEYVSRPAAVAAKDSVLVNCTADTSLVVKLAGARYCTVKTCTGETVFEGKLEKGLDEIDIPLCGIAFFAE